MSKDRILEMRYLLVLSCLAALIAAGPISAQNLNPYARLTDPIAIARLDAQDFAPLRYTYGWGNGFVIDSNYPGFNIYAHDTGAGVITHLFVTMRTPDLQTNYKLIVDGQLLRSATDSQFFLKPSGFFHSPFDTIIGEARLGDVQIPYHQGFELLFKSRDFDDWFDYGWRPLPGNEYLPLTTINSNVLSSEETQAIAVYNNPSLIWQGISGIDTAFASVIPALKDTTLLTLKASAVINNIKITPETYDTSLDSVWLDIYYDDAGVSGGLAEEPAISTPLLALFGQSFFFKDFHSIPIDFSIDSGFTMRLPIPFAHSMRLEIRNLSHEPRSLAFSVTYTPQAVDITKLGYLHAAFSQSNPTKFHVLHPVLHRHGKGVYVGLIMGIHDRSCGQVLEGDAIFTTDSSMANSFHYEGTEDYFNGAQYFSYGPFLSPFGGEIDDESYYRFHYFDAFDFNKSFDFDFQHGNNNDAHDDYRTLAFWYEQQIPFWTDKDTLRAGEAWEIAGTGYTPGEQIEIMLDSTIVALAVAYPAGEFDLRTFAPKVNPGYYSLSVNGVVSNTEVLVSSAPTIVLTDVPKPIEMQPGDTLHFTGAGFVLEDTVIASISGVTRATSKCIIDFSRRISGWLVIPELADGNYNISLDGLQSGSVVSPESIHVTRTLRYECEDLWTSSSSLTGTSRYLNLEYMYGGPWSQNAVLDFDPVPSCSKVSVHFNIPYADTFAIGLKFGCDSSHGNYDIFLDGVQVGQIAGYNSAGTIEDSLSFGEMPLDAGDHTLSFQYTGRNPAATDSILWADYIQLAPTSKFQNADTPLAVPNRTDAIFLYPDPASDLLSILDSSDAGTNGTITITDELGRVVLRPANPLDISVAELPSGIYHLRMEKPAGVFEQSFSIIH